MRYNELVNTCKYKTLLYLCVFDNRDYMILLLHCLLSLLIHTKDMSSIDILVFTSNTMKQDIINISEFLNIPIDIYTFEFQGKDQAVCSKLYIFEYPLTQLYKQVLYIDTDVIIQSDLNILLNTDIKGLLYGVEEGTINDIHWGAELFDFTTVNKNLSGINGGILLFKPTNIIKNIFLEICNDIRTRKVLPYCSDQSFINYYFIKNSLYDNQYLTQYTRFYSDGSNIQIIYPNTVFCHFTWPIGDAEHKLSRMLAFFINLQKNSISEIPLGTKYSWNSGYIQFDKNKLNTYWGIGNYYCLDKYLIFTSWNGYSHFLVFSPDYSSYKAFGIYNLEYTKGKKMMEYYDEYGNQVDTTAFETVEQSQAEEYITENATVLELGARYGTVSCIINKKLKNPMNQVSVEPDAKVWDCLEKNMKRNGCNFHLIKGVISRTPLILTEHAVFSGYGNQTVKSDNSSLPNYTIEEIQEKYNLVFDTLVADCEGFLGQFFEENPNMYRQLQMVLFEKDSPGTCDYNVILKNLKDNGFTNLVTGFHEVWKKIPVTLIT